MIQISTADCTSFFPFLPNYAKLAYCDPPRNKPKNKASYLNDQEMFNFTYAWVLKTFQHCKQDSYVAIFCDPKDQFFYENLLRRSFCLRPWQHIIWSYNFGVYTRKRFVPSHEIILIYKLGHPKFYWDQVAVASQRLLHDDKRADLRGRTPASVWRFPRVPGNDSQREFIKTKDRSTHPVLLAKRLILALTVEDDYVYDPFTGTGTVPWVCLAHKRNCIAIDIEPEYVKEARARVGMAE